MAVCGSYCCRVLRPPRLCNCGVGWSENGMHLLQLRTTNLKSHIMLFFFYTFHVKYRHDVGFYPTINAQYFYNRLVTEPVCVWFKNKLLRLPSSKSPWASSMPQYARPHSASCTFVSAVLFISRIHVFFFSLVPASSNMQDIATHKLARFHYNKTCARKHRGHCHSFVVSLSIIKACSFTYWAQTIPW